MLVLLVVLVYLLRIAGADKEPVDKGVQDQARNFINLSFCKNDTECIDALDPHIQTCTQESLVLAEGQMWYKTLSIQKLTDCAKEYYQP